MYTEVISGPPVHRSLISLYDGSVLTSTYQLVYKQWQMDHDNDLLIEGYFRRWFNTKSMKSYKLPNDIKNILKTYYLKKYSKQRLIALILERQETIEREKIIRKQQLSNICKPICYIILFIGLIGLIGVICGVDIAGLIINSLNECNLSINSKNSLIEFGVEEFLFVGCIIHIVYICAAFYAILLPVAFHDNSLFYTIMFGVMVSSCFMILFFVSWSIVGFVLYSEMNQSNKSNKQCADIVISWSVITIIECVATPYLLFLIIYVRDRQRYMANRM